MNKAFYLATSAFVFLILYLKNPTAIDRPEFWAEDGINFFKEALEMGYRSLFFPLGGYQNLVSRLIALISVKFFPLRFAPTLFSWSAFLLSSFMIATFSLSRFERWIKDRTSRIILCLAIALAPGSIEVTQAICNIHTVMGLFAVLLVLMDGAWGIIRWSGDVKKTV